MQSAVDAFLRYLRIERNASPLTLKSYHEDLESLFEFFKDREGGIPHVASVTTATLRGYVAYLHECQYAKRTIARRLACLRSLFRYCTREKLVEHNPAQALRTPRVGRSLPHFLTTEQVVKLLEAAKRQDKYWQTLERLLETQANWSINHTAKVDLALKAVSDLGLDMQRLEQDMRSPEFARLIEQDLDDAVKLGVSGTPWFFANGKALKPRSFDELKAQIESAVQEAYR